ncbi:hypothetical protein PSA7680_01445 [Pseudoruegeria aquimaris]|uniref:DUF1523 domain-containing protein n=1 Tax=Pseudoruegeria aquimaris TaxID=393663 RepID=A0A1Y5S1P2_9RHOB|nr:DUF1523 family protein [Pseudoruegeria aquimaris]SLN30292.1 hypothetical protein PSA7680_01445 [Pseudoruegeria aquimaris]
MRYVKWGLIGTVLLSLFAFLHYTLPRTDIVIITGVDIKLEQVSPNSIFWANSEAGTVTADGKLQRDVRFINTTKANGKPRVYRNEDTGWGWPPYFKLDSSNLHTEAQGLISTRDNPQWVAVRAYGWRSEFLSIYPNAVSVWPVEGPDVRIIPWINIVILTLLAAFAIWLWRVWVRFKERRIDPVLEDAAVALDELDDRADAAADKAKGLFGRMVAPFRRK